MNEQNKNTETLITDGLTPEVTIQVEGNTGNARLRTPSVELLPILNRIEGTNGPDILFGTPESDIIIAKGGNDTIFGSLGDDVINGGLGFDTLDYTSLGRKITLLPQGFIGNGSSQGSQIQSIERIVGPRKKNNTIDGFGIKGSPVFFTIDLTDELLVVENIPRLGSVQFEVENFVNVKGTDNSDSIIGNRRNNKISGNGGNDNLIGGLGNDTITGGSGDDTLVGSDPFTTDTKRKEKDSLRGGIGGDKFVLGNKSGSFYDDFGNRDFANILDFSFGDQIQLGSGETYRIKQTKRGFNIFLVEDSGRDLIAKVTISLGITDAKSRNNAMLAADSASLESTTNTLINDLPKGDFEINSGQEKSIFVA